MSEEEEKISPDAFKEQFSDAARELNGLPKQAITDNIKERMNMEIADKVWIALGVGGVVIWRQHRLKKQIRTLKQVNTVLNKENQVLHILVSALSAEPGKFAIDKIALKNLVKI